MTRPRVWAMALAFFFAAPALSGCVSLGRTTTGVMPPADAVAGLKRGATLREVLDACGAPVEAWRQPDGLLLIYRERHYDYDRLGLDPSRVISFLGVSALAAEALSNLKLVLERASLLEERLVVVFDADERVSAFSFRGLDGRRTP